jgi:hypothetical protein
MRSRQAVLAALAFLLALPTAWLWQVVVADGGETAIHVIFAAGSVLLARAAWDFDTPRWTKWVASAAAGALGAVFVLQAVALASRGASLSHFAFDVLGRWPEGLLAVVVLAWFATVLIVDSRGATRVVGWCTLLPAIGFQIVSVWVRLQGTSTAVVDGPAKLLLLLPFVWLITEGAKRPILRRPPEDQPSNST